MIFRALIAGTASRYVLGQIENLLLVLPRMVRTKEKLRTATNKADVMGAQGNCRIWWKDTAKSDQPDETDGQKLLRFVKSIPVRSIIRHHVAGDIGESV